MEYVVINALAYVIGCIYYIRKYGALNPGTIIFEFITLTAILAVPAYYLLQIDFFFSRYNFTNVTFLPFIFLYLMNVLFISQFFKIPGKIQTAPIDYNFRFLKKLANVYILCALASVYLNYRLFQTKLSGVEWSDIRQTQYAGEALVAYNNIFERFFLSFASYFQLVACIIFMIFFLFHKDKCKIYYMIIFALALILPVFMDAMRTASRGMVIALVFRFLFLIGFFFKFFTKKQLGAIALGAGVFLIFAYGYSMAVTTSRFDDTSGNNSALICYWGQPQIIFNSAIAGISKCWMGKYAFGDLLNAFGLDSTCSDIELGIRFLPCFTTIVGNLYCDFLFFGPLLYALLLFVIFRYIYKRKVLSIAEIYLMYFLCLELQHGALVMRINFLCDQGVYMTILIYLFLKHYSIKRKHYTL